MDAIGDFLVAGALGIWFVVSVVAQVHNKRLNRLRRLDHFSLIPLWTFFAPNPGKSDYHLIYRDELDDGSLTAWTEIPLTHRRTWLTSLWNPTKRETKVLADIVNSVASLIEYHAEQKTPPQAVGDAVMLSTSYLILMNIVFEREKPAARTVRRQFALVETQGFDSTQMPAIIFYSPFHSLNRADQLHAA